MADESRRGTDWTAIELDAIIADYFAMLGAELAQRPLYIVTTDEMGIVRRRQGCFALVGPALDIACREAIGPRWRGRGWCILMDRLDDGIGTLVHELGHILDGTMPWRELGRFSPEEVAEFVGSRVREQFAGNPYPQQTAVQSGHGPEWHRAIIHLRYRAMLTGASIGWHEITTHARCPMHELVRALGDEPHTCRHKTFADFMARPLPRRFRKLWNRRHVAAERTLP